MKSEKEQEYRSLKEKFPHHWERFVHHFENFGVENIMYAIADSAAYTNGVDTIHPLYDKEWYVDSMVVNKLNLETGEYEALNFGKQDFLDFLNELMAADTKKHPDLQKYYKLAVERIKSFKRYE